MLLLKRLDEYFTDRRKAVAALCAVGFAILWMILWNAFPMEFYSLFFAGIIGGNIQLLLLNIVTLLPLLWIFTKLTKTNLSFSVTGLVNILLLIAADYLFSLFLFSDFFFICVIALLLHMAANVPVFGNAEVRTGEAVKGMKVPTGGTPKGGRAIKKQPLITVIWAAAFAFTSEAASFALLYIIAHIYAY